MLVIFVSEGRGANAARFAVQICVFAGTWWHNGNVLRDPAVQVRDMDEFDFGLWGHIELERLLVVNNFRLNRVSDDAHSG